MLVKHFKFDFFNVKLLIIVGLGFQLFNSTELKAQGTFPFDKKKNSVIGVLAFTPENNLTSGYPVIQSTYDNHTDPAIANNKWIESKQSKVRGFIKEAVMYIEWWTLLSEPAERYQFKWRNSGYFEVEYLENGTLIYKTITRDALTKYPDLLKTYDAIEPSNIDIEISFAEGEIPDQEYNDFRRRHNILSSLGSAGLSMTYKRKVPGSHWLFARSGENPPLVVPEMEVTGWRGFLGLSEEKYADKGRLIAEIFRIANGVKINSFKITSMRWPVETFVNIAKQYERYEKKLDSPKDSVAKAPLAKNADGGDDFWNEPEVLAQKLIIFKDPMNNKFGMKDKSGNIIVNPNYKSISKTKNKNQYICINDDYSGVLIINSFGKFIAQYNSSAPWFFADSFGNMKANINEYFCERYTVTYSKYLHFNAGTFTETMDKTCELFQAAELPGLTIIIDYSKETYEERIEREREWEEYQRKLEIKTAKCKREAESYAKSLGLIIE